jgi:hypothetical protein
MTAASFSGSGASLTGIPAPSALTTASGSAPSYSARAWVNFNGTGTVAIRASGNVSSITDNGTGDYTVNFTTAMPDANYSAVITPGSTGGAANASTATNTFTTGAVRSYTRNQQANIASDQDTMNVAIFR